MKLFYRFQQQLSVQGIVRMLHAIVPCFLKKNLLAAGFLIVSVFIFSNIAKADYTIASGSSINANTITAQSGVLTINGTLLISSDVSLLNFTSVIINGPNGQIFWQNNKDLTFSAFVTITINSNAPGLQPTNGNAAKRLIIGTTVISVSNTNSNNAAFSFAEFNAAGGLPQFILGVSTSSVCLGTAFTATITPLNNTLNYDCTWTISAAGIRSPTSSSNFNTPQTTTITPAGSGNYTVSCTLFKAGDNDPIITRTKIVTVNAVPATPTSISATPVTICQGSSSDIKATSAGNTIQWYTVNTGGTSIGSSASAINYVVSPAASTTYYAEAKITTSGCVSAVRSSVAVTVNPTSVGGNVSGSANVCSGSNNSTLTLSVHTGSITRWESSIDNFATTPVSISNTTVGYSVSNLAVTTYYRAVITSGICSSAYSSVALLAVSNPGTWLGVNTNWNSTLNWCNGTIPTTATNVVIPNGLSFYPIINTTAAANNITVATGGSALISVTGTLTFAGAITSANGINATAGTIEPIGTVAQFLRADNFVSGTIANLKVNNTLASASASNPSVAVNATGGMLKVSQAVMFGNLNNAVLQTNDNLTLLSSSAATASIADVTNNNVNAGNTVAGKTVVERYIPAKRAWRLLTAPVSASSNVKMSDAWQEGATPVTNPAVINSSNDPNAGYGTHITFGNVATNGYDQGINGNTSIRYLTNTGWNGVPTATNNGAVANSGYITDQPGYMLFVRGNRSTLLSSATAAALTQTILRSKGSLNIGQLNVPIGTGMVSGSSQFRVIGNPYASAINFHKIAINTSNVSAGFADAFYFWDPNITGTNGVGGWVAMSYNTFSSNYDRAVLTGGSSGINNSGDIQSGSAFVIDYGGVATSLRVTESHKATGSNNSQFRPIQQTNQVRVSLLAKNNDNTTSVNDAVLLTYNDSYNSGVDNADMKKLSNFTENLSVNRDGQLLAIERRKSFIKTDTINFQITQMKQKNYTLQLELDKLMTPDGTTAILEDKFLDKKLALDVKITSNYDFNVVLNSPSAAADRFRVLFKPAAEFAELKGFVKDKDALLEWTLKEEFNIDHFEIERSEDGNTFYTVGRVTAKDNVSQAVSYNFADLSPATANYFYRIKAVTKNAVVVYSGNINITILNSHKGLFVFPNPVTNNNIHLKMNSIEAGYYNTVLLNAVGVAVTRSTINYNGGLSTQTIKTSQQLSAGTYLLKLTGPSGKIFLLKVFVQVQ